mmetsp:Transcript_140050/g.447906  ORF Transcript_140050/g.447906 Transcript_140050/m.447906 type:complete len:383 (-) Transcript_140050:81-1229(-)
MGGGRPLDKAGGFVARWANSARGPRSECNTTASSVSSVGGTSSVGSASVYSSFADRSKTRARSHDGNYRARTQHRSNGVATQPGDLLTCEECANLVDGLGFPPGVAEWVFSLQPRQEGLYVDREAFLKTLADVMRAGPRGAAGRGAGGGAEEAAAWSTAARSTAAPRSASSSASASSAASSSSSSAGRGRRRPRSAPAGGGGTRPARFGAVPRTPTFDSSGFLMALQGGEPLYDEIFLGEKAGNSMFGAVGPSGLRSEAVIPSPPKHARPAGYLRTHVPAPPTPPPKWAAEASDQQRRLLQQRSSTPAAGKASAAMGVHSETPREMHPYAGASDTPRGRSSRNTAICFTDHKGKPVHDVCFVGSSSVAHAFLSLPSRTKSRG